MSGERAPVDELLGAVRALTASNDAVSDQLEKLKAESVSHRRYGLRNRHLIWLLAVVVVVLLLAGIIINAVQASKANDLARQVHETQVSNCQQSNVTRVQQIQIWDYVLAVPPATPPTAAQRKIRADFKAYVHRVFAPRDCDKI
jgi:outer membrane murein-binding lipoprotein Lpp